MICLAKLVTRLARSRISLVKARARSLTILLSEQSPLLKENLCNSCKNSECQRLSEIVIKIGKISIKSKLIINNIKWNFY